ncbi:MAG TPA: efflux RND transporter periplasmic adaptor subunit [Blastocatellia bacterium]|nr:efflux RND transporter periplasmic adaptor subunit [Blastocatellia bacterium]
MAERLRRFIAVVKKRRTPIGIAVLLLAVVGVAAFIWGDRASASDYITAKVDRGNVEVTVSATGTVQAVTTVQVGSQVSGTVSWLGADFNSQVTQGQVIARLDPAIFDAQVENARANVANAEAAVQAAQTEINNQKANLQAAKANQEVARVQSDDAAALVKRYQELKTVLSGRELEAAQAQASAAAARLEQAKAQVVQIEAANASAKAKLEQAKAAVAQAKAQLQQNQVNLDHSIIKSPIDGVVVSRSVDVGQTVAASLQAPTLFTIANDLTKMQVLASIDEADVGQIRPGIKANFSVDAFPGEVFSGNIMQLRLNAQTQQNVVTYSAVIEVSNPQLKLRPGMTANITTPVARRDNVLIVPNAALRFKPSNLTDKQQEELRAKMEERTKELDEEWKAQRAQASQQEAASQDQQGQQGGAPGGEKASASQGNRPSRGEGHRAGGGQGFQGHRGEGGNSNREAFNGRGEGGQGFQGHRGEGGNFNREAWRQRMEAAGGNFNREAWRQRRMAEGAQQGEAAQGNRAGGHQRGEGGQGNREGFGRRQGGEGGQPAANAQGNREGGGQNANQQVGQGQGFAGGGRGQGFGGGGGGQRRQWQTIWVLSANKQIEPRFVRTGLTNGRVTEIVFGDLHEGDTVIIGQNDANASRPAQQTGSPFQQQRPPGGGRGPGR